MPKPTHDHAPRPFRPYKTTAPSIPRKTQQTAQNQALPARYLPPCPPLTPNTNHLSDITEHHLLPATLFKSYTTSPPVAGSPLAEWATLFLNATFEKNLSLNPQQDRTKMGLQLHDPLTVWYASCAAHEGWEFKTEDLRVETSGQWTRGCKFSFSV